MTLSHLVATAVFAAVLIEPACADEYWFPSATYEVTTRLELPHLERWAVDRTTTACLPSVHARIPIPVQSANNPFVNCTAKNVVSNAESLQYDIVCPGRGAAKAHAVYTLTGDKIVGYVDMVMGAKNMTMREILHARRVGDCEGWHTQAATRF